MTMVTWDFDDETTYCAISTTVDGGDGRVTYHELSETRSSRVGDQAIIAPGPTLATVTIFPPDEEKPPMVYFNGPDGIPFAALQHFVNAVAASLEQDGA